MNKYGKDRQEIFHPANSHGGVYYTILECLFRTTCFYLGVTITRRYAVPLLDSPFLE